MHRPPADFTYRIKGNVIDGNSFMTGSFFWNTIELAGGGTTGNTVRGNAFSGNTLTHIDLDKGTSWNVVDSNTIFSAGSPPRSLTDTTTGAHLPNFAIADHGSDSTYLNVGNRVSNNRVERFTIDGAASVAQSAAYTLEFSRSSSFLGNVLVDAISAIPASRMSIGMTLEADVVDAKLNSNVLGKFPNHLEAGIVAHGAAIKNLSVMGNRIEAQNTGFDGGDPAARLCATTPNAALTGWRIERNTIEVALNRVAALALSAPGALVSNNTTRGGIQSLYLNTPGGKASGNLMSGPTGVSVYALSDSSLSRNTASGLCRTCPGATLVLSGNAFGPAGDPTCPP